MLFKVLGVLPILVMLVGVAAAHFEIARPLTGFAVFAMSAPLGLVIGFAMIVARWRMASPPSWIEIAVTVIPFAIIAYGASPGFRVPRINDITTDTENPPQFSRVSELPENKDRTMTFPSRFAPLIKEAYSDLEPHVVPAREGLTKQEVLDGIKRATLELGWSIVSEDVDAGRIEATAMTRLFRFRDDVIVRVVEQPEGFVIDMRSKSRDGVGDLGANAARIHTFFKTLRV